VFAIIYASTNFIENFMTDTKKRAPGYPITINQNVEQVRQKIQGICEREDISASALFDIVVEKLTDEQWTEFAAEAKARKDALALERYRARTARMNTNRKAKLAQQASA
jgi:hypothetical protein